MITLKKKKVENDGFSMFFETVFLLFLSLIYGTLFFELSDNILEMIQNYSFDKFSVLLLQIASFFRILESHLLAALKYSDKWKLRTFDFILVFVTGFFEYTVIKIETLKFDYHISLMVLILLFSAFGIIGYILTFQRICNSYSNKEIKVEKKIQCVNVVILIVIGMLSLISLIFNKAFNLCTIFISILLFINTYLSFTYSKNSF